VRVFLIALAMSIVASAMPANALMRAPALKMWKYRGRNQSWVYKPCKAHHYKPKPAKPQPF
jgi:hypothetical protein